MVLRRNAVIGWGGLLAIVTYQLLAAVADRNGYASVSILVALLAVSAAVAARDLRTPPSVRPPEGDDRKVIAAFSLFTAAAVAGFVAVGTVRADATIVLAPYPFAWWYAMRGPLRRLPFVTTFAVSGGASLLLAYTATFAPYAGRATGDILVIRAAEGCVGSFGLALLIARRASRVVAAESCAADALTHRAVEWAAESSSRTRRLGRALRFEMANLATLRPHTNREQLKVCERCVHLAAELDLFDQRVDEWLGDDLEEVDAQIRRVARARWTHGISVRYGQRARVDSALFVRRTDFEVVRRLLYEVIIPESSFVECDIYADDDDVEFRFLGQFQPNAAIAEPVTVTPWDERTSKISVTLPLVPPRAASRPAGRLDLSATQLDLRARNAGVYSDLIAVLLVAQLLDIPGSLLQIAAEHAAIPISAWIVAAILSGLSAFQLFLMRRHPELLFAPGAAVRSLTRCSLVILAGAYTGVGGEYLRGVGYPQPFARYLLASVMLVVVANRVWPDGIRAYCISASTLIGCAALSGHAEILVTRDGLRAILVWPYWLAVAVVLSVIGKRSLREVEDITLAITDENARGAARSASREPRFSSVDSDEPSFDQLTSTLARTVATLTEGLGCDRCDAALDRFTASKDLGDTAGPWAADAEHAPVDVTDLWREEFRELATLIGATTSVAESCGAITIRLTQPADDVTPRLKQLAEELTNACGGWVTWGSDIAATIERKGVNRDAPHVQSAVVS